MNEYVNCGKMMQMPDTGYLHEEHALEKSSCPLEKKVGDWLNI
jgi:hypothetical protein